MEGEEVVVWAPPPHLPLGLPDLEAPGARGGGEGEGERDKGWE